MNKENAEGKVVINTELRNKNLIDGYKNISKETDKLISQFDKKVEKIKKEEVAIDNLKAKYNQLMSGDKAPASLTAMETQLKKNEKEVANLEKQYNEIINKINLNQTDLSFAKSSGNQGQISFYENNQTQLDNQSLELATKLEDAKDKSEKLRQSLSEMRLNPTSSLEVKQLKTQIDLATNGLEESKKEANELAIKIEKVAKTRFKFFGIDANTISKGFDKVNTKLDKFKNKMARLIGTAMVFSLIRSGLTSLSREFISLLKTNDSFSNSLNQIKANLMTAFAPIYSSILPAINTLMNALSTLTGTIATFINGLFGNTASQAKKNAKELYNQAKATNALKNAQESLGSFDKLEVNTNEETTGVNVNNGINFNNEISTSQELLDVLNGIKDFVIANKELILGFIGGLVVGIEAFKFGLDGIKALGLGIMIAGIISLIASLISYLNDPSWNNFGKIITSIGVIVLGLGVILGELPVIIAGIIVAILGLIISNWDKIKTFFQNIIQWIYDHLDDIKDKFGIFGVFIATLFANFLDWLTHTFDDIFGGVKKVLDGIIDLVAGIFTGDWKRAWNGIKEIFSGIFQTFLGIAKAPLNGIIALINGIIDGVNFLIKGINKISFEVPDWVPGIGGKKLGFNIPNIGKIPYLATGAVIPPNKKFTAVLGDQKNGKNLEAPEDLIRKIVREESGEKEVILNATFIMQCETEEIGRAALKGIHLTENIDGKPYLLN